MKICNRCFIEKSLDQFHKNGKHLRSECKTCGQVANSAKVVKWRQQAKEKLVKHFGSKCVDCQYEGPPFMFDFDHRDHESKLMGIGGSTRSYDKLLAEAEKCDLVCANCHRFRTHLQRCLGCEHCEKHNLLAKI